MDPQKIIRHISFYDRKPARKPKMFAGDQMTSRQFGGWKQVTTLQVRVGKTQIAFLLTQLSEMAASGWLAHMWTIWNSKPSQETENIKNTLFQEFNLTKGLDWTAGSNC